MFNTVKRLGLAWYEWVVIALAWVLIGTTIWLVAEQPLHGLERVIINQATLHLEARQFSPLTIHELGHNLPPLFFGWLLLIRSGFGDSLLVTRLSVLPFAVMLLTSVYVLSKKLDSKLTAHISLFVLLSSGLIMREVQVLSLGLVASSFIFVSLAYWLYDRPSWAVVALSLGCWFHWWGIFLIPGLVLDTWLNHKNSKKYWKLLLVPLAVWSLWQIYHLSVAGWLISPTNPFLESLPPISMMVPYFGFILKQLFTSAHLWIFSSLAVISGVVLGMHQKLTLLMRRYILIASATAVTLVIFWSLGGDFDITKGLPVVMLWYVLAVASTSQVLRLLTARQATWMTISLFSLIIGFQLTQWRVNLYQGGYFFAPLTNLTYLDLLSVHRQATAYVSGVTPNATVLAATPEQYYLTQPQLGYVDTPMLVQPCSRFEYNQATEYFIYIHPFSQSQVSCHQLKETRNTVLAQRFTENKIVVEIHQLVATSSAQNNSGDK